MPHKPDARDAWDILALASIAAFAFLIYHL